MNSPVATIEYLVNNLVDNPEQVVITHIPGASEDVIELRVAESDLGKVIGKNGSVARALRVLLSAMSIRAEKNYLLEIID